MIKVTSVVPIRMVNGEGGRPGDTSIEALIEVTPSNRVDHIDMCVRRGGDRITFTIATADIQDAICNATRTGDI
jgi:hypothetical protein